MVVTARTSHVNAAGSIFGSAGHVLQGSITEMNFVVETHNSCNWIALPSEVGLVPIFHTGNWEALYNIRINQ